MNSPYSPLAARQRRIVAATACALAMCQGLAVAQPSSNAATDSHLDLQQNQVASERPARPETRANVHDEDEAAALVDWQHYTGYITSIAPLLAIVFTAITALAAWRSARAAVESNRLNRDTFIIDQRPWISIEAPIASDLTYEDKGARLYVLLNVSNIGKSPATNSTVVADIFSIAGETPSERLREFCDAIRAPQTGKTIFPGGRLPSKHGLLLFKEEIESSHEIKGRKAFMPIVIACATYKSPVSNETYQTGLAWAVLVGGRNHVPMMVFRDEGEIAQSRLGLDMYPDASVAT